MMPAAAAELPHTLRSTPLQTPHSRPRRQTPKTQRRPRCVVAAALAALQAPPSLWGPAVFRTTASTLLCRCRASGMQQPASSDCDASASSGGGGRRRQQTRTARICALASSPGAAGGTSTPGAAKGRQADGAEVGPGRGEGGTTAATGGAGEGAASATSAGGGGAGGGSASGAPAAAAPPPGAPADLSFRQRHSVAGLAFLGDAVWELYARRAAFAPPKRHAAYVAAVKRRVTAEAQVCARAGQCLCCRRPHHVCRERPGTRG